MPAPTPHAPPVPWEVWTGAKDEEMWTVIRARARLAGSDVVWLMSTEHRAHRWFWYLSDDLFSDGRRATPGLDCRTRAQFLGGVLASWPGLKFLIPTNP